MATDLDSTVILLKSNGQIGLNYTLYCSRHANADGKNAAALIRQGGVPLNQFLKYCASRRKTNGVDDMVITKKNIQHNEVIIQQLEK